MTNIIVYKDAFVNNIKVTLFTQLLVRHIVKPNFNPKNSLSHVYFIRY